MLDILEFKEKIEYGLTKCDYPAKKYFALWCCQSLFDEFGEALSNRCLSDNAKFLDQAWINNLTKIDYQNQKNFLISLEWEEDVESIESFGVIELIESLINLCEFLTCNDTQFISNISERLINRADYEESMFSKDGLVEKEQALHFDLINLLSENDIPVNRKVFRS